MVMLALKTFFRFSCKLVFSEYVRVFFTCECACVGVCVRGHPPVRLFRWWKDHAQEAPPCVDVLVVVPKGSSALPAVSLGLWAPALGVCSWWVSATGGVKVLEALPDGEGCPVVGVAVV